MMSESAKRVDFEDKVLPYLEGMLRRSLWLTKSGPGAVQLMRGALAEAYRSWDGLVPGADCKIWLLEVLTRRFLSEFQRESHPSVRCRGDHVDESVVQSIRISRARTSNPRRRSSLSSESDEDAASFGAVASLPAVLRSAMILSYLEGFSKEEIANLAGVQPKSIAALLNRGHLLIREELFAHLLGSGGFDTTASVARKRRRRSDGRRKQ